MNEELSFFIYLLEHYAAARNRMTGDVLHEWDARQLTDRIYGNYWGYHTECLENAFADIDRLMEKDVLEDRVYAG